MTDVKHLIISFVLFGLFAIFITTLILQMGNLYGTDVTEVTGGGLSITALNDSIQDLSTDADSNREQFEQGDFSDVDSPTGIVSVLTDTLLFIFAPIAFMGTVMESIGIPAIFVNVVLAIIIVLMILGVWRAIRSGS